jgi:hypothetical protein
MVNYQNGKIYQITTQHNCKIYIGSTTQPLHKRFHDHKLRYNLWNLDNEKKYLTSFQLLDFDDCKIELLENFPCNSFSELTTREGYYMKLYRPFVVNHHILSRTDKEWRDEHKSYIQECNKKYYEENKEQIIEQHEQYREENKEHVKELRKNHRENNIEKYTTKDKKYYNNNIDKIKTRNHALKKCETCNIEVKRHCYYAHLKTKQHIKNLQPNL